MSIPEDANLSTSKVRELAASGTVVGIFKEWKYSVLYKRLAEKYEDKKHKLA